MSKRAEKIIGATIWTLVWMAVTVALLLKL